MAKWTGLTVKIGCNAGGTAVCSTDPPTPTEWVELGDEHNGGADGATCFGVSCSRHSCPMYANGNSDCGAVDGTLYQHRWPSGTVGEGAPEFRVVPQVMIPSLNIKPDVYNRDGADLEIAYIEDKVTHSTGATVDDAVVRRAIALMRGKRPTRQHVFGSCHIDPCNGNDENEDDGAYMACCHAQVPVKAYLAADAGQAACPSCGHDKRRCRYCRGLLVPQYGGAPRCQDCHNTQEVSP